ncbi:hypothetical protein cce_0466 [Crocosphaera subtropica ATCC 51142]|uniref:Uncharacterized protein n=1 Tax=Crocosphaera subtropica (strain ATCC 51142 / BH68) TaxID=43989 RepID=B1WNH5_CROS5|nr:hypothetical protein cce_0466 [Crocosphaera subtropica ATCC 51142]
MGFFTLTLMFSPQNYPNFACFDCTLFRVIFQST